MNNNTKARYKRTNNESRAKQVRDSNPRNPKNKKGKVAAP